MHNRATATLLASALILGSSMVGCSGASLEHRPAMTAAQTPAAALRIEKALGEKDFARALIEAERLVDAAPRDGAYRALLGRAYLANGRYLAAGSAFGDAMTLGNRDPRTIVSLSLVETGLGRVARAQELLSSHIQDLPAGDYGLAMAMAGDPQEGVRALLEAVKLPEANAKTRQNLAYAFALAGEWEQARLIAGQDMDAGTVQQRVIQWAQVAQPGREPFRVAALIGVAPRLDDPGMPVRLALRDEPVRQADAGSLVEQAEADMKNEARAAPVEMAAAAPIAETPVEATPALVAPATLAAAFDAPAKAAPLLRAPAEPMRQALRASFTRAERSQDAANAAFAGGMPKPVADERASGWVIQLGAYDSKAIAIEKWARIKHAKPGLKAFAVVNSTIDLKGRVFHRLAMRGFGDRATAAGLCGQLRSAGQACFVRLDDSGAVQMAAAKARGQQAALRKPATRQFAAR